MVFTIGLIVFGLILIFGIIFQVRWEFSRYSRHEGYPAIWVGAVGAVLVTVISLIGSANPPGLHPEMQKRYSLHSLVTKDQTDSKLSGSFFLGFGGVQGSATSKTKIVYIRTDKDGGNTIQDTKVGRSIIYEDLTPDSKPYVEDWVSAADTTNLWVPWTWHYVVGGEPQHRFHIPKGSIMSNYEVNP